MRLALALCLAALLSPASAQTQYADSSGGFVALHGLSFGQSGSVRTRGLDAAVGYRFGNGADVSLRGVRRSGFESAYAIGPTVGFTRSLGSGFDGRVEGSLLGYQAATDGFLSGDGGTSGEFYEIRRRSLDADATATVSRSVRLVGSLRLRPTVGLFARTGTERTTTNLTALTALTALTDRGSRTRAGVHVALPLSFRLFGQTASFETAFRFPLGSEFRFEMPGSDSFAPGAGTYAGGGLRLNF